VAGISVREKGLAIQEPDKKIRANARIIAPMLAHQMGYPPKAAGVIQFLKDPISRTPRPAPSIPRK